MAMKRSETVIVTPALRLPVRQALRMNFSQRLKAGVQADSEWTPAFAGVTASEMPS